MSERRGEERPVEREGGREGALNAAGGPAALTHCLHAKNGTTTTNQVKRPFEGMPQMSASLFLSTKHGA